MNFEIDFNKYKENLSNLHLYKESGKVIQVQGNLIQGYLPGASLGSLCQIFPGGDAPPFLAEVVGFKNRNVLVMSLGDIHGVKLGSKILLLRLKSVINVGTDLLGRVINSYGQLIDSGESIRLREEMPIYSAVINPLKRAPISEPLDVGVRSINGLLTVGKGQRIAILSGSGVGKSILMGMMARSSSADVNVIALIGERGREVREFIEQDLGEEGLKRSVIIVATGDDSPLVRMRAAFVAMTIADFFSSKGNDVLFMMDSITRFAMAQREIGLSAGEPPTSKGYTPSVFSLLPKILERAGHFEEKGSITGVFTTLVEGDDLDDPIGDAVRSIVDGHIVLSRKLAARGQFPAIDILNSTSRVMRRIVSEDHVKMSQMLRENLAIYEEAEDLINIGAYKTGLNSKIDFAVKIHDELTQFLKQGIEERSSLEETTQKMKHVLRM